MDAYADALGVADAPAPAKARPAAASTGSNPTMAGR
jgi:hypothetical protein